MHCRRIIVIRGCDPVRPKKKISQTQLAKDLGVSQALVSLALNGRSDGINPDTYQRIWDRAISLGYLPKGMRVDSAPEASRGRQVGYILRAPLRLYIPSTYFGHVQHGLHQELETHGHRLAFLGAEDELPSAKLRAPLEIEQRPRLARPDEAHGRLRALGIDPDAPSS